MIALDDIRLARAELPAAVQCTPLLPCEELGSGVFLKCENLQVTGSYKTRGAFTVLNRLAPEQKRKGAALTSSGNFAGAFAYMGRLLDIPTVIVMMEKTSPLKIERTRGYGGEVVLCENRFEARFETLERLRQERGLAVINHLEDMLVPIGHGILGLEILDQIPDADVILVPVSTGGLLGGVAAAIKLSRPFAKVIGVQPEGSNALYRSLQEGKVVRIPRVDTICDALTAEYTGELMFQLVRKYVDEIVLVSDDEVRQAIRFLCIQSKLVVEPGGAVTVAALLAGRLSFPAGNRVVAVLSGGNIAADKLAAIITDGGSL